LEDIDTGRCTPEFAAAILDDLAWLGVRWDGPVLRQSTRLAAYAAALSVLRDAGLIYPCFASRGEIAAHYKGDTPRDPDGAPLYPGLWRGASRTDVDAALADGRPFAWRLDMTAAVARAGELAWIALGHDGRETVRRAEPELWGDVVLGRKETPTSYHLAVVVDDAAQSVTHVTRGLDLEPATHVHRLLQALLGFPTPLYHHHPLVTDAAGRKLSKSAGDEALAALRDAGVTPAEIRRRLAARLPLP
jgi:glutamyl-Q tRNA(Asp) synthetase